MISIKGTFNKGKVIPDEKVPFKGEKKVIITFLENDEGAEVRKMSLNAHSLDFWNDSREDIYNDLDPKNESR